MIEYKRSQFDAEVEAFIYKLDGEHHKSLIVDVTNNFLSPIKVYKDGFLAGILLVRGEIDHFGDLTLVIVHAIAADKINFRFSDLLGVSLWEWVGSRTLNINVKNQSFRYVRQHANRPALVSMCERFYDEISEVIFIKDLRPSVVGQKRFQIKHVEFGVKTNG